MEETDNYWENRRTIRRYADRDVPSELLDGLLLKASHAPTTGNMQLYSVIVTRDEDARQKLAPASGSVGACGAYVLCRFPPYVALVRGTCGRALL